MKTALKNVSAFIAFTACVTYVILSVTILPATQNGLLAATTGQAFAFAVGYLFFVAYYSTGFTGMYARLKRTTRKQIKLLIAEIALWLVALSALAFSCMSCTDQSPEIDEAENDFWTEGQTIHKGDTVIYIDYRRADNLTRIMTIHAGKVIDWQYSRATIKQN